MPNTSGSAAIPDTCLIPITVHAPLKRQVFISHTGKDNGARVFAASILKDALERAGLPVFIDFASLKRHGEVWPAALLEAATCSAVVVVVMSKGYTQRFWCMLELDLALHKSEVVNSQGPKPLVIPVFYDDPEFNRIEAIQEFWTKPCGQPLLQHLAAEEYLGPQWARWVDAQRWADNVMALNRIQHPRLSSFKPSKDAERRLAMEIVERVVEAVPWPLTGLAQLFGMERKEAQLMAQLVGHLGLWLHGVGKWIDWFVQLKLISKLG